MFCKHSLGRLRQTLLKLKKHGDVYRHSNFHYTVTLLINLWLKERLVQLCGCSSHGHDHGCYSQYTSYTTALYVPICTLALVQPFIARILLFHVLLELAAINAEA